MTIYDNAGRPHATMPISEDSGLPLYRAAGELRRLAMAATPGEWTHKKHGVIVAGPFREYTNGKAQSQIACFTTTSHDQDDEGVPECKEANADFCAAANPAAILRLLDALDAATAAQPITPQTVRKAYICTACEFVYCDKKVSQCDCMPDKQEYIEGTITYPSAQPIAPAADALYLIFYDDTDMRSLPVLGEKEARAAFDRVGGRGYNAHLFVKVASNSRDDPHYTRNAAPAADVSAPTDERAAFEAWFDDSIKHPTFAKQHRYLNGYATHELANRWKGWQARAAAPVVPSGTVSGQGESELPPLPPCHPIKFAPAYRDFYTDDAMRAYGQLCIDSRPRSEDSRAKVRNAALEEAAMVCFARADEYQQRMSNSDTKSQTYKADCLQRNEADACMAAILALASSAAPESSGGADAHTVVALLPEIHAKLRQAYRLGAQEQGQDAMEYAAAHKIMLGWDLPDAPAEHSSAPSKAKPLAIAIKALERLALTPGCGCSFPCRCDGPEWSRAELEGRMDVADEALTQIRTALAAPTGESLPVQGVPGWTAALSRAFMTLESTASNPVGRHLVLKFNQREDAYAVHEFLLKAAAPTGASK